MTDPQPATWLGLATVVLPLAAAGVRALWKDYSSLKRQLKEEQRDHRKTLRAFVQLQRKYDRLRGSDSDPPPI